MPPNILEKLYLHATERKGITYRPIVERLVVTCGNAPTYSFNQYDSACSTCSMFSITGQLQCEAGLVEIYLEANNITTIEQLDTLFSTVPEVAL